MTLTNLKAAILNIFVSTWNQMARFNVKGIACIENYHLTLQFVSDVFSEKAQINRLYTTCSAPNSRQSKLVTS